MSKLIQGEKMTAIKVSVFIKMVCVYVQKGVSAELKHKRNVLPSASI